MTIVSKLGWCIEKPPLLTRLITSQQPFGEFIGCYAPVTSGRPVARSPHIAPLILRKYAIPILIVFLEI